MKKLIALTLALLLLSAIPAFADSCNVQGYKVLRVTDVFQPDPENNEDVSGIVLLQGSFGDFDMSNGESDIKVLGFDASQTYTLGFADDCVIEMPEDQQNDGKIVPCDDLIAWFALAKEKSEADASADAEPYSFYATFEMNAEGALTKLSYLYMP